MIRALHEEAGLAFAEIFVDTSIEEVRRAAMRRASTPGRGPGSCRVSRASTRPTRCPLIRTWWWVPMRGPSRSRSRWCSACWRTCSAGAVQRQKSARQRRRLVLVGAACLVVVLAGSAAAPLLFGSSGRPSSGAPAHEHARCCDSRPPRRWPRRVVPPMRPTTGARPAAAFRPGHRAGGALGAPGGQAGGDGVGRRPGFGALWVTVTDDLLTQFVPSPGGTGDRWSAP